MPVSSIEEARRHLEMVREVNPLLCKMMYTARHNAVNEWRAAKLAAIRPSL